MMRNEKMMEKTQSDKQLAACKLAGKLQCAVRIYQLMVILTGAFTIFAEFVYLLGKYEPQMYHAAWRIFTLFLLTCLSYIFFLLSYTFSMNRRTKKEDLGFRKMYNIALYEKIYAKRYKPGSSGVLLRIAKQQLLSREFDEAEETLKKLKPERLEGFQQKSQEFYEQLIDFHKKGEDAYVEAQLAMLANWEDKENSSPSAIFTAVIGILILYSAWFFLGEDLLPTGYYFRYRFYASSVMVLWIAWSVVVCWLCYRLMHFCGKRNALGTIGKIFLKILTVLASIFVLLAIFVFEFFVPLIGVPIEVEEYEDGILLMQTQDYDPYTYYNQAVGPFLRRELTVEEEQNLPASMVTEEIAKQDSLEEKRNPAASDSDSSTYISDAYDDEYDDAYWEDENDETALRLEGEVLDIRQYLIDTGELEDIAGTDLTCDYTAKGSLYLTVEAGIDESGDYRKYIVYDRGSDNEQCDLFVYYLDRLSSDGQVENTQILNFFAVRISDGTVIPANKTSWSETGSAEYRDATGSPALF